MKIYGKIKKISFIILIIISNVCLIIGLRIGYIHYYADKFPYKDLLDFYNYIYVDVQNKQECYTITIEGSALYGNLRHYKHNDKYSEFSYLLLMDYSILLNKPIEINDTLNSIFKSRKVNKELCKKYQDIEFIEKTCMDKDGLLNDSLNNQEDEYAIIYTLLKSGDWICFRQCESGYTAFTNKGEIKSSK